MATVSARVATEADLDSVAETLTLAFRTDPVWGRYSFPDTEAQVEQSRRFWAACAAAAMRFPWTHVTQECEAVAAWIPPNEPEMTDEQATALEALTVEMLGADQASVVLDAFAASMPSIPTTSRTTT